MKDEFERKSLAFPYGELVTSARVDKIKKHMIDDYDKL